MGLIYDKNFAIGENIPHNTSMEETKRKIFVIRRKKKIKASTGTKISRRGMVTSTNRTEEEMLRLRRECYMFLFYASVGDSNTLKSFGYGGCKDTHFIQRWKVGAGYIWQQVHRKEFKKEYYEFVTQRMSRDLHPYLWSVCTRGKERVKGLQMVFPEEVGKSLATRNISVSGEADDREFRDAFFGLGDQDANK